MLGFFYPLLKNIPKIIILEKIENKKYPDQDIFILTNFGKNSYYGDESAVFTVDSLCGIKLPLQLTAKRGQKLKATT